MVVVNCFFAWNCSDSGTYDLDNSSVVTQDKQNGMKYYRLNDNFICLIGLRTIEVPEVSDFISSIHRISLPEVRVQMINARAAYGPSHLLGVMMITLECQKRGLTLSLKPEMDLLLRLSFTNQIGSALSCTGLKAFHPAIVILFSTDK